jgi:hypothetical protein
VLRQDAMTEWVSREFSKADIDRAGRALVAWWSRRQQPPADLGHLFTVVENWRTSHAYPLNAFQVALRSRARRVEEKPLVAQRLKRFASVMNKLAREPQMQLSQMQDLGGCRAILSSASSVQQLFELYRGGDSLLFDSEGSLKCYDYVSRPKPDGYRGIHVVGRFSARSEHRDSWNGYRIEIQLRSRLQHAFATAVETVTTFTRQPLKFGAGPAPWRRFFSLMGSALAIREGTRLVPGTPSDPDELVKELRDAARSLKVRQRLKAWSDALQSLPRRNVDNFQWLLLVLDLKANTINVTGFSDGQRASEAVAEIEQRKFKDLDAVLVWVNSARDLRAAYPNYYADTSQFLKALNDAIGSSFATSA